jgi:hypothetical protein
LEMPASSRKADCVGSAAGMAGPSRNDGPANAGP